MLYIYLGAAIFYLLSVGGVGWYGLEHGKKLERADWQEKEIEQRDALGRELSEAMKRVAEHNEKKQNNALKVINEKDNAISDLESRIADANRLRITTVKSTACIGDTGRGKSESPGISVVSTANPGTGELRGVVITDDQVNAGFRKAWAEQEKMKIFFKQLRGITEDKVNVVK
jgi:hypothetical protein